MNTTTTSSAKAASRSLKDAAGNSLSDPNKPREPKGGVTGGSVSGAAPRSTTGMSVEGGTGAAPAAGYMAGGAEAAWAEATGVGVAGAEVPAHISARRRRH